MKSRIKEVIRNPLVVSSIIYNVASFLNRAIPFLLLPILTRYLSPTDYGYVATFSVICTVLTVICDMGSTSAVYINYYHIDKNELPIYVFNAIVVKFAVWITLIVCYFIIGHRVANAIEFPVFWLGITIFIVLFKTVTELLAALFQINKEAINYGKLLISGTAVEFFIALVLIVVLKYDWHGRIVAAATTSVLIGIVSFAVLINRKSIKIKYVKKYIVDALKVGIPCVPHTLGYWMMTAIDRFFINKLVNVEATGLYSVGYQLGNVIYFMVQAFNQAWIPHLFEQLKKGDFKIKVGIVKFTYLYAACLAVVTIVYSLLSSTIVKTLVGGRFVESTQYVPWVAAGAAFQGLYFMVTNYIFYVKKTHYLAGLTFSCAILNVVLNYYLIKRNGALGAAQATALIFGIYFIVTWVMAARVYRMPWFKWSENKEGS